MSTQTVPFNTTQFKTLLSVSILVFVWIMLAAQSVNQPSNVPSIEQRVVDKIQKSGKGVILGIAAHGEDITALTDNLLTEVESNRYYAPVFFSAEGTAFQQQLKQFGLAQDQLPAVIYFNQQGNEISRTIKIKANTELSDHSPVRRHLHVKSNTEYLVALSQALSTL